jgi:hypothetical protein
MSAPLLKNKNLIDWALEDPKGKPIEKVGQVRDLIEQKVMELIAQIKTSAQLQGPFYWVHGGVHRVLGVVS